MKPFGEAKGFIFASLNQVSSKSCLEVILEKFYALQSSNEDSDLIVTSLDFRVGYFRMRVGVRIINEAPTGSLGSNLYACLRLEWAWCRF